MLCGGPEIATIFFYIAPISKSILTNRSRLRSTSVDLGRQRRNVVFFNVFLRFLIFFLGRHFSYMSDVSWARPQHILIPRIFFQKLPGVDRWMILWQKVSWSPGFRIWAGTLEDILSWVEDHSKNYCSPDIHENEAFCPDSMLSNASRRL